MTQGNYEKLRNWYLARLRKRAIERSSQLNLTPAALIAADKKVVEDLIVQESRNAFDTDRTLDLLAIWIIGTTFLGGALALAGRTSFVGAIDMIYALTLGVIFPIGQRDTGYQPYLYILTAFFYGWPILWFILSWALRRNDDPA